MRFSSAVDSLARENARLWLMVRGLGAALLCLTIGVMLLYDRSPVMILRSSRSLEIVAQTPLRRTQEDIEQAVRLMLKARFDTGAISPEVFLSTRQLELRSAEQAELKSRQIEQTIIVRALSIHDGEAEANIDRVLSVGELRSALKAKIRLAFEEIAPNELNPCGLRLVLAEPLEKPQEKSKKEGEK